MEYFIEHTVTRKWWHPVLDVDEETKAYKISDGWTRHANTPGVAYKTREAAQLIIERFCLLDVEITEHLFIEVQLPIVNRPFS